VLVSDIIIAQTRENSWSELLTSGGLGHQASPVADAMRTQPYDELSNVVHKTI